MKKLLIKNCDCLKTSLLVFFSINVLCNKLDAYYVPQGMDFADVLFDSGDYNAAMLEYKRLDFACPQIHFKYRIAECYEQLGDYENAIKYYEEIGDMDSVSANSVNKDLIRTYIKLEDYSSVRALCEDSENDKKTVGWAYLLESRYDEAAQCFEELGEKGAIEKVINYKNLPYKSEITAGFISTFLPGGGEIYAGSWKKGLVTFMLNGTTGFLTVKSFLDHRYLDGTLIACLLWNRFYRGGINNAESTADKYNKRLKEQYLNSIRKYMEGPIE